MNNHWIASHHGARTEISSRNNYVMGILEETWICKVVIYQKKASFVFFQVHLRVEIGEFRWPEGHLRRSNASYELWLGKTSNL